MREAFHDQLVALENRLTNALEDVCTRLAGLGDVICSPGDRDVVELARAAEQLRLLSRGVDQELVVVTARQAPVAGGPSACAGADPACPPRWADRQPVSVDQRAAGRGRPVRRRPPAHRREALRDDRPRRRAAARRAYRVHQPQRRARATDQCRGRRDRPAQPAGVRSDLRPRRALRPAGVALRHVLIARSLERIGDNAVDIAEQVAFPAEGRLREFTTPPNPTKDQPRSNSDAPQSGVGGRAPRG